MNSVEPFVLFDCGLARCALGRRCSNLRELQEAVRTVPDAVLEHHMVRCALEDHFELYEFPNDLARWCWEALGDQVLAEQLGLVDPYRHESIPSLRSVLVDAIEDRLWRLERVPWCRPGLELHLIESRLIAYDTGERIPTPAALCETIERMSPRSLFYHVHEARRRTAGRSDDFSAWLEQFGAEATLVARLRAVDFYFLNLTQLRQTLVEAFRQSTAEPNPVGSVVT
ncbi:MAG: hypothetical protein HY000_03865 [Planctomycetes bacterium]|nr:hypothetical protein [Planctomycetota bacterium]